MTTIADIIAQATQQTAKSHELGQLGSLYFKKPLEFQHVWVPLETDGWGREPINADVFFFKGKPVAVNLHKYDFDSYGNGCDDYYSFVLEGTREALSQYLAPSPETAMTHDVADILSCWKEDLGLEDDEE